MSFGTAFALPSTAWQSGGLRPSLALNFLTGSLPSGVTYTRAVSTGTATYTGSNGYIQNAGTNVARFDYDPASYVYQNLVPNSTTFTGGDWDNTVSPITVNANTSETTAPDGTSTACKLTTAAAGQTFLITNANVGGNSIGTVVSIAIYLKPTANTAGVYMSLTSGDGGVQVVAISAGAVTSGGTDVGNGWRRYTANVTNNAYSGAVYVRIGASNSKSFYMWGPQVGITATPTPYYATSGTPYSLANIKGLLIEQGATNVILQSQDYTAAQWTTTANFTTAVGVADYSPANDVTGQFVYAAAGDGNAHPHYMIPTALPLTPTVSSPYTMSGYFKFYNPDSASYTNAQWMQMVFTSGGFGATAYVNFNIYTGVMGTVGASITSSSITYVGFGWYRVTATANATVAVASGVQVCFISGTASPVAESFIVQSGSELSALIWGIQLESGNIATTYLVTGTISASRNADSAVLTTLTPWYNTTEGTLYTAFSVKGYNVGVFNAAAGFSDNTTTNFIVNRVNPATQGNYIVRVAGVDQANVVSSGTTTANTTIKIASTYKANDFAMSLNGGTVVTDTSGTVPTVSRLVLGATGTVGTNPLNGWLRTLNFYNARLSDATLQSIST